MSETSELAGKVAVVTGGTRGLGRAIVERLALAGARVIFTGRDATEAAKVEDAVTKAGGKARFIAADQSKNDDWPAVMAAAEGGPDIVVLNAGVSTGAPIHKMTLEMFRGLNDVNLKGVFLGLKHGVEAMRKHGRGGSVVLVASIVGKIGVAGMSHYTAAKAGVRLMAKAAALELGPEQIRVNSLHPGMFHTQMTGGFDEAAMSSLIPLGRFGEPPEVAAAALFLASDRSKFMTGAELVVDGGWLLQ